MGLSVVRCPFCDHRYNVTGIPSGTKVLCTSCKSVLTVPRSRFIASVPLWRRLVPQGHLGQGAAALLGGLLLAVGTYLAVHSLREGPAPGHNPTPMPAPAPPPGLWATLPPDLQQEFDPARFYLHRVPSSPFVLIGEKHPQVNLPVIFEYYGELLPKLYERFHKDFGDPLGLKPINGDLYMVLYTDRKSFEAWWNRAYNEPPPAQVPGAYSYVERRVGLFHDRQRTNSSVTSKEVLLHEAIHQIVHHYYSQRVHGDRPQPWWFQEGLAAYFEGFRKNSRGDIIPDPSKTTSRLPAVKELLAEGGEFIPLQKLMGWHVDDIWKNWLSQGSAHEKEAQVQKLQYAYAESWALVHFLRHGEEQRFRSLFMDYLRLEMEGKGSRDAFAELLRARGLELHEFEARFKDYARSLE